MSPAVPDVCADDKSMDWGVRAELVYLGVQKGFCSP